MKKSFVSCCNILVVELRQLGFGAGDLANGGSDRLIDALLAGGDLAAIRSRIQAHRDPGADHVCIQAISHGAEPRRAIDERLLGLLAPGDRRREGDPLPLAPLVPGQAGPG